MIFGGLLAVGCARERSNPQKALPLRHERAQPIARAWPGVQSDRISAGAWHSLLLGSDGGVWAWGDNTHGQLGDGTTLSRSTPARVPGLTGVVAVAAGDHFSLALRSDGTVRAWGDNGAGQLGDGSVPFLSSPGTVPGLSGVISVAAGGVHSLAL